MHRDLYINRVILLEQNTEQGLIEQQLVEIMKSLDKPTDIYSIQKLWHQRHPNTPQHRIILDQKIENNLVNMIETGVVKYDEETKLLEMGEEQTEYTPESEDEDVSIGVPEEEIEDIGEEEPEEEAPPEEEPEEDELEPMPVDQLQHGESWKRPLGSTYE